MAKAKGLRVKCELSRNAFTSRIGMYPDWAIRAHRTEFAELRRWPRRRCYRPVGRRIVG